MTSNIRQALFQVLLLTTFSEEGSVIVDNGEQVMETDGGCNVHVQCTLCFKFLFPFYHYALTLYCNSPLPPSLSLSSLSLSLSSFSSFLSSSLSLSLLLLFLRSTSGLWCYMVRSGWSGTLSLTRYSTLERVLAFLRVSRFFPTEGNWSPHRKTARYYM